MQAEYLDTKSRQTDKQKRKQTPEKRQKEVMTEKENNKYFQAKTFKKNGEKDSKSSNCLTEENIMTYEIQGHDVPLVRQVDSS